MLLFGFVKTFKKNSVYAVIVIYLLTSYFTLVNSPKPYVDTFDIFKDVFFILLKFINPYSAIFSSTYPGAANHFHYLPFSFIFTFPFSALLKDPRYSIIFANVTSSILLYNIYKKNTISFSSKKIALYITVFLFLPRSFYILEHMYLDPIIFMFFLLFYYFKSKIIKLSLIFLSVFFSIKQHIFMLFPIFLIDETIRYSLLKHWKYFLLPFVLIVFFIIIDTKSFFFYTVYAMLIPVIHQNAPVRSPFYASLSFLTFLNIFPNLDSLFKKMISVILFLCLYIIILIKKCHYIRKVSFTLFVFCYFMYLSFYNHYYFIALFIYFDFFRNTLIYSKSKNN